MIGLLTETIGSPTPMQIPLYPAKQLPKGDYLAPIAAADLALPPIGGLFGDRQQGGARLRFATIASICFTTSGSWATTPSTSGNRDSWTITPKVVDAASTGGGKFIKGSGATRKSSSVSSTTRQSATLAASSSPPTRPIS